MTPTYLNSSPSPFPVPPSEDQKHQFNTAKPQASSSSCLLSHVFTYSLQDQGRCYDREVHHLKYQQEANNFALQGGSHDHPTPEISDSDHGLKFSLWKKQDVHENYQIDQINGSATWMSSKMRLMRKMMNSHRLDTQTSTNYAQLKFEHQTQHSSPLETDNYSSNSSSSNSNNPPIIRVCADCNTTKTPLWRSGPRGPKSLCNACGIRQRKARRAMAAAAAASAAKGTILASETSSVKNTKVQQKHKSSKNAHVAQYKKRSKLATTSHEKKKLCFEDFLISLSKNLAFHRVFPQDEKEAAILLMALSCGHVHG